MVCLRSLGAAQPPTYLLLWLRSDVTTFLPVPVRTAGNWRRRRKEKPWRYRYVKGFPRNGVFTVLETQTHSLSPSVAQKISNIGPLLLQCAFYYFATFWCTKKKIIVFNEYGHLILLMYQWTLSCPKKLDWKVQCLVWFVILVSVAATHNARYCINKSV